MDQAIRSKTCAKTYKTESELKVKKILNKIDSLKLNNSYISRLDIPRNSEKKVFGGKSAGNVLWTVALIFVCLISARWVREKLSGSSRCMLEFPFFSESAFRPPVDCSMCVDVNDVVRLEHVSAEQFENVYAYSGIPVIVTDATHGWKALTEFDFKFFANYYNKGEFGKQINHCTYFPYKSGLKSLQDVFTMDEARANLSGEPWYVGWGTCFDEETKMLRSYYDRPYFLPRTAESYNTDWIFMGGPGQAAQLQLDTGPFVSWQAQVRGQKQWLLAPPPECLYQCRWLNFTVSPGEILVVDTNTWYHKTNVLPGDISISIGAEYD